MPNFRAQDFPQRAQKDDNLRNDNGLQIWGSWEPDRSKIPDRKEVLPPAATGRHVSIGVAISTCSSYRPVSIIDDLCPWP